MTCVLFKGSTYYKHCQGQNGHLNLDFHYVLPQTYINMKYILSMVKNVRTCFILMYYFQGSSALALQGTLASATQQPNKNCTKRLATGSSGAVLSTDRDSNWVIIFSVSSTCPGQSGRL